MTPSNEEIWDERGSKWGGRFTRHPFGWSLIVLIGIVAVMGSLSFIFGWINTAADVASPRNVTTQYAAVIEDWNGLEAAAENACNASSARTEQGPTLLEDPALAYKAKYRQIAVDYNRRQTNIFEAGLVGPDNCGAEQCRDLAPTLAEMQRRVC